MITGVYIIVKTKELHWNLGENRGISGGEKEQPDRCKEAAVYTTILYE